jgi:hypothetical protein
VVALLVAAATLACEPAHAEPIRESTWSLGVSLFWYLAPGQKNFWVVNASADHGPLHIELRYHDEAIGTASALIGWRFDFGETVKLGLMPSVGALLGDEGGPIAGLDLDLSWGPLFLSSQQEWVWEVQTGYARGLARDGADPTSNVFSDEILSVRRFVPALAARARGDAPGGRGVIRDLVAWRRWKVRTVAAFALGQACAEDGDLECAVAALRQYRAEPLPIVIYRPWMLPRSARLLAEVLERQGKVDAARRLVEAFLSDWRAADPGLLDLTRARALCARLHCQPASEPTVAQ